MSTPEENTTENALTSSPVEVKIEVKEEVKEEMKKQEDGSMAEELPQDSEEASAEKQAGGDADAKPIIENQNMEKVKVPEAADKEERSSAPTTTRKDREEVDGAEITKWSIRRKKWEYLEKNNLVNFPRPAYHRIPNFKGATEAADKAATLEVFQKARTVKINPDKPQEHCRFLTLEANKNLLVPTPRLRRGLFNKITPPEDPSKADLRKCSTSQGVREFSKPVGLDDKVSVDLVLLGSVAVSRDGYRIGKGEGFGDLEFAMMATMGAVDKDTIVVTTVHDCQVSDIPADLMKEYDIPVDFIVTPTEIIECPSRPKPGGIVWSKLTEEKLNQIPVLKKLRYMEYKDGRDVRIQDEEETKEVSDTELPEDDDFDPRRRDFRRRRPRPRPQRENKGSYSKLSSRDSEGEGRKTSEGDGDLDAGSEKEGARDRRRFNRRRRPRRERKSTSGDGEDSGKEPDEEGEDSAREGQRSDDRRRRNRRRRRSNRDASEGEDGEQVEREPRPVRQKRPTNTRRGPRGPRMPAIYVGSLPRSLRVSEFKGKVREQKVDPLRVIWHGGSGHAFLQFEKAEEAEDALRALEGLTLNGKEVKVEMSNNSRGRKKSDSLDNKQDDNESMPNVQNSNSIDDHEA